MSLSLKPKHLSRYRDLAVLLAKHGRKDWIDEGHRAFADHQPTDHEREDANALADALEELGPTYVKLGQMLSGRPDLLPPEYIVALSRLQDDVAPIEVDQLEEIFSEEIGMSVDDAFESFDRQPLSAASLGQVHRATLRNGRRVVVKIQRPGIREQINTDMSAFAEIAEFAENNTETGSRFALTQMLERSKRALIRELDYRSEANNLLTLKSIVGNSRHLVVPEPIPKLSSGKVLTMDFIEGRKISHIGNLERQEVPGRKLAKALFRSYLDQVLIHGFVHADPHPGNVLLTTDNQLALIDLGMVERVDSELQDDILRLLIAMVDGEGRRAARVALDLSDPTPAADEEAYIAEIAELVERYADGSIAMKEGRLLMEICRVGSQHGVRPPAELTVLGKTLLHLDQVVDYLDDKFVTREVVRDRAEHLVKKRLAESAKPANMATAALDSRRLMSGLPRQLSTVLDNLADNKFRVEVEAFDERLLIGTLQKIANRITTGLIVVALILGAALLTRVPSELQLFGYPVVATVLFLIAFGCGVGLLWSILRDDIDSHK